MGHTQRLSFLRGSTDSVCLSLSLSVGASACHFLCSNCFWEHHVRFEECATWPTIVCHHGPWCSEPLLWPLICIFFNRTFSICSDFFFEFFVTRRKQCTGSD